MNDETRCKERVYSHWRSRQCHRKAWKDGYCKQHHPDTVKARRDAANKRYEEKQKQSPWYKLEQAHKRIAELEAEIKRLRGDR